VSECVNCTEIYRRIAVKYYDNIMSVRKVHKWVEMFKGYRRVLLMMRVLNCHRFKYVEVKKPIPEHPGKRKNKYMKGRPKYALKELNIVRPKIKGTGIAQSA
jgi:hypothetical protein